MKQFTVGWNTKPNRKYFELESEKYVNLITSGSFKTWVDPDLKQFFCQKTISTGFR